MSNIKFTSRMISLLFSGLTWLYPLLTIYFIMFDFNHGALLKAMASGLFPSYIHDSSHLGFIVGVTQNVPSVVTASSHEIFQGLSKFTFQHRMLILLVQGIPLSITAMICFRLAQLFKLYEKGDLFENSNIQLIKNIGILMIVGELLQFIYQPLMSLVLTITNPVGERYISMSFDSSNISTLLTGCIILTASLIVKEANQLKSDAQFTI